MFILKKPTVLLIAFTLSACNLAQKHSSPSIALPTHWQNLTDETNTKLNADWWQAFGSTELNTLIRTALRNNYDLSAAQQRIQQAKAQSQIAAAPLLPAVSATGSITDTRYDDDNGQKKGGLIDVAYEVDLWGANRAARDKGLANLNNEQFSRAALSLSIMAQVAQNYFTVLALIEQQRIIKNFIENLNETLIIAQARLRAGAINQIEVAQQESELANAKASLELLKQQRITTENALAILLAKSPQLIIQQPDAYATLAIPDPKAEQPASLLERRPDIRASEMAIIAAETDVTRAKAAFYPSLKLSLEPLFTSAPPASFVMTMAASLAQPLFQGGRLEGQLSQSQAITLELIENYKQNLITALREVEDAAATKRHSQARLANLNDAVDAAARAYELSDQRYRVGLIDYQTLLNTQRSWLTSENNRVQAKLTVLTALVQLYKALGGGWEGEITESSKH
ncbi:efflux transporter outer membrane subunit [Methylocucumis oryzae]|uniref:efflux transporter outer membrane subunit n=1 Tax=Methylocucumis oryzae TaxID=1632867 RepID=UPI000AB903BA